ncbi:AAEL003356-PA [Aedes aegypti]|uniref:AAEL003356-PA n=2 Tax=Aedes aegypti TaxID=7159 RepID=A0A1S4F4R3_AEDAE|nr:uncharacterized protein LOC5577900 [Aedes aegypti]EAT45374.1 AAEL003356-PA [Aedes aegypti]
MDPAPLDNVVKLHDLHLRATQTLQLIGQVEANRVLYDTSDQQYNTKKAKSAAWKQISAAVLGIKPEQVSRYHSLQIQHKWKSLRTAYVRQKRKNNPAIPYRYADLMSFLDPYLRRDEASSGASNSVAALHSRSRFSAPFEIDLDGDVGKDIATSDIQDACIDLFDPIEEDLTCDTGVMVQKLTATTAGPVSSVLSTVGSTIAESNNGTSGSASTSSSSSTPHISPSQMDELDGFFMQISRTVRKFSPRKIIELKMQIFNLVSQAELDELDAINKY